MTRPLGEMRLVAEIAAEPERIWAVIRRFGQVADWNPVARSSRLVAGVDAVPGAERELQIADGGSVRERLTGLDDAALRLDYEMLSFPIPVTAQRNRITVAPGTVAGRSLVTFSAHFMPKAGTAAEDVAALNRAAFAGAAVGIGRLLDVEVRVPV